MMSTQTRLGVQLALQGYSRAHTALNRHRVAHAVQGGEDTWWHQSERARGPLSERVNWGASRRHAAARPPWPIAAKRSPPSLKLTCTVMRTCPGCRAFTLFGMVSSKVVHTLRLCICCTGPKDDLSSAESAASPQPQPYAHQLRLAAAPSAFERLTCGPCYFGGNLNLYDVRR